MSLQSAEFHYHFLSFAFVLISHLAIHNLQTAFRRAAINLS